ncbi:MAG: matrixin family metalloprotease [Myxococcota bacterium]|nr:matrixin family metalloprotease [Myxococcota bacterium]
MVRFLALLCVLLPTSMALAQVDASALECGSSATYYPRGDHWAIVPPASENKIIIRYQEDGPEQSDITAATAIGAVNDAFSKWLMVDCTGSGVTPNIQMDDGYNVDNVDYPDRDRGESYNDDGELITPIDEMKNIIYWVKDEAERPTGLDSGTVGLTTNLHFSDSGFVVTGDMEFNGIDYQWRAENSGCTAGANDCYDIHAVALHEAGHFFGFDHVQCTDAVMFPEGSSTSQLSDLSVHEETAICTIYPPRVDGSYDRFTGERCTTGTHTCPGDHVCVVGAAAEAGYGWCAAECTTTDDCGAGFVCCNDAAVCGEDAFCKPGLNATGDAVVDIVDDEGFPSDLCAPCGDGTECFNGLCVHDDSGNSICTQSCVNSDDLGSNCPTGFGCLGTDDNSAVCWPGDMSLCGTVNANSNLGVKNDLCYIGYNPGSTDDDAYGICGGGLVCFLFRLRCYDYNNPSNGQEGNCVEYCNAFDKPCENPEQTCCFGITESGNCNADSSAMPHGGCFDIRTENESCVTSEKSICSGDAGCFYLDQVTNSKCFALCDSVADCRSGQSCNTYNDGCNAFSLCEPPMDVLAAEVGQACNVNADCASGDCLRYGGQAACTSGCNVVTKEGCPDEDLDGDGVNDEFECLILSGEGQCWRKDGPVLPPVEPTVPESGGCACALSSEEPPSHMFFNLLLGLLVWCFRPSRRRFFD